MNFFARRRRLFCLSVSAGFRWEGEEGAILVGQVYFRLQETAPTMFLQFFIQLTDGEGGRGGGEGRGWRGERE